MAFLNAKVTSSPVDYGTMLTAGVVKFGEERALAPFIGNATLLSAVVKGGIGYAAHKYGGSGMIGNGIALGFTVDAVEDGLTALMGAVMSGNIGGLLGGGNGNQDNW